MTDGADVRSLDALRDWQAALAEYGSVLAEALAGIQLELRRAYDWLDEQLASWQRAVQDREDEVTRAKAELAQRQFPTWDGRIPDCTVQERNLRRARLRLEQAREQVDRCRQWRSRLPKLIDETYSGPSRRLSNLLESDLPKALADLARRLAALESYAGLRPDYHAGSPTGPPAGLIADPTARPPADQLRRPNTPEPPSSPPGEPA